MNNLLLDNFNFIQIFNDLLRFFRKYNKIFRKYDFTSKYIKIIL